MKLPAACSICGTPESTSALLPHGPKGSPICLVCAMAPERLDEVAQRIHEAEATEYVDDHGSDVFRALCVVRCPSCNTPTLHHEGAFACRSTSCSRRGRVVARVVFVTPEPAPLAKCAAKERAA